MTLTLLTEPEKAVVRKDFSEIWTVPMVRNTLIAVPACMVIVLPVVYLVLILTVPTGQMNGVEQMLQLMPKNLRDDFNLRQSMFYLMTNLICPMFFLMIPLMASSVSAACSFVGEKERGTIETLLLCPVKVSSIFKAKVIGCVLLSMLATAISFAAFAIVIAAGDILLKMPFFLNWSWLVLLLLFSPALNVFGVIFMVLVSGRSKSYLESMQLSGYVVLPLVLIFVGQFTGLFQLDAVLFLFISVALAILDAVLGLVASRSFTPEKLLK